MTDGPLGPAQRGSEKGLQQPTLTIEVYSHTIGLNHVTARFCDMSTTW